MSLAAGQLTQVHRRQQLALRKAVLAELERLWPALDWANLDETYPRFAAEVATLVSKSRKTSTGLAAAYLRAFRVASGLSGDVRIIVPQMPREQFTASLHSTSVAPAKASAARGVEPDVAMANALTLTAGAMSRLVLNAGRSTLIDSIESDERATGWRRVLGSGGCDYCRERAGRRMTSAEVFEAHGKCGCTAEPIYA